MRVHTSDEIRKMYEGAGFPDVRAESWEGLQLSRGFRTTACPYFFSPLFVTLLEGLFSRSSCEAPSAKRPNLDRPQANLPS